jgi:hypothetical protein
MFLSQLVADTFAPSSPLNCGHSPHLQTVKSDTSTNIFLVGILILRTGTWNMFDVDRR